MSYSQSFWKQFAILSTTLRQKVLSGELRFAFDTIEKLLIEHNYHFVFELTHNGECAVLILTPEGNQEVASQIDDLLAIKPSLNGWIFYGRRQRKSIEDALTFVRHIYKIDVSDCRFELKMGLDGFDINLVSEKLKGLSYEESQGIAATLLDHAIGEDIVMTRLVNLRTDSVPSGRGMPLLSLKELVAILLNMH